MSRRGDAKSQLPSRGQLRAETEEGNFAARLRTTWSGAIRLPDLDVDVRVRPPRVPRVRALTSEEITSHGVNE